MDFKKNGKEKKKQNEDKISEDLKKREKVIFRSMWSLYT